MTTDEFCKKWHLKLVKPISYYKIPDKIYHVTAALYHHDNDKTTVFAIMAVDYTPENKQWITFNLTDEDVDVLDQRFEIVTELGTTHADKVQEFLKELMISNPSLANKIKELDVLNQSDRKITIGVEETKNLTGYTGCGAGCGCEVLPK